MTIRASNLTKMLVVIVVLGGLMSGQAINAVELVSFNSHQIQIEFDVPSHKAIISDSGQVDLAEGFNLISLAETVGVSAFRMNGDPVGYTVLSVNDTIGIAAAAGGKMPALEAETGPRLLIFSAKEATLAEFYIQYSAVFNQDVSQTRFSRENVGGEINGTIGEQGAYLAPSSYYYPSGKEDGAFFTLSVTLPEGWEAISDGNRIASETVDGTKRVTYQNPFVSDGNMFMAAPYVIGIDSVNNVEVACFFFAEDSALIPDYLESTVGYIKMYSDLIGPYPYTRFTVAENFFPTGYGMPAWTLLGQQVIRLPFIKATSLGHEVLHNWWGNSVYVDYERGNWCESATVYGADYRYKLNQSPAAAKAYRKNILKAYVSYVRESNDFPIREFKGRTSANTRVIGYSKAMMVWHMLEEEVGSEPFWQAWKIIYERYVAKQISWEEWIAVLEETSGMDLSHIIPQWIDRPGAPILEFFDISRWSMAEGDGRGNADVVQVQVRQISNESDKDVIEAGTIFKPQAGEDDSVTVMKKSLNPYQLIVPIRYKDQSGLHDTVMILETSNGHIDLPDNGIEYVEIDPDYHLFRKLYPEEVEPIVSAVLGLPSQMLICDSDDADMRQAFGEFGGNLVGDSLPLNSSSDRETVTGETAPIVINPETMPDYYNDLLEITSDSIRVLDDWFPTEGHTFILSGNDWMKADKFMVVLTADPASLPRIGQLVPHYGKYSYLVFEGAKNVGKGQWPVTSSPLKKVF